MRQTNHGIHVLCDTQEPLWRIHAQKRQAHHVQHRWEKRQGPESRPITRPAVSSAATVEQSATVWTATNWRTAKQEQQVAIWQQHATISREHAAVWTANAASNIATVNGSEQEHAALVWIQYAATTMWTANMSDVMGRGRV